MAGSGSRRSYARSAPMSMMALGLASLSVPLSAVAADVQAGKAVADARCISCHEADDWEGESAASLESLIRDIVAGSVKHKQPLQLTPAEIANIAAYWAESSRQGSKRR